MFAGTAASIALSTALLMKRDKGVAYIKEVRDRLIAAGYTTTADALVAYIKHPPQNEDEDAAINDSDFLFNPKHSMDEELIPMPAWLQEAF